MSAPERVLEGRVVVITGAGGGLGRAYALDAAARGAQVVVNDVNGAAAAAVVAEIAGLGGTAFGSEHSVVDGAEEIVDVAVRRFGRLDGLVNNAGLHYEVDSAADDSARQRRLLEVNVLGTLACGSAALHRMVGQGGGSIVNVVSGAALGIPRMAAYGASKGAVLAATYAWAVELHGSGVRVNAVSPLATTGMTSTQVTAASAPEVVAPIVSWLLGPGAAGVHGQVIRFTGTELGLLAPPFVEPEPAPPEGWTWTTLEARLGAAARTPYGLQRMLPEPA